MSETYIEKRKRGFFGWIFLLLFLAWNVFMIAMIVAFAQAVSAIDTSSAAGETGKNIGVPIGAGMILFIWAFGSIITGMLALLTRGSKTVVKRVNR